MKYQSSDPCSCEECVSCCQRRPGWPTPPEAQKIIELGLGNKLMLDWWVEGSGPDTYILSPAIIGSEGDRAPGWPRGRCVFLSSDDLCELHDLGAKPYECRASRHDLERGDLHGDAASTWRGNRDAVAMIEQWKRDHDVKDWFSDDD